MVYGAHTVTVTPYLDGTRYSEGAVGITGAAGTRWDTFVWDVAYWDSDPNLLRNIRLLHRAKALQLEYLNSNANEPFALKSVTIRSFVTDSGDPRVH